MNQYPQYYDPNRIGKLFYPDIKQIADDAMAIDSLSSVADSEKISLLLVDMQIDFCHDRGSLYIPGAQADIQRVIEFIFRNSERIGTIISTLDSHLTYQIFHPCWWLDEAGNHPAPFTIISYEDVISGEWRPLIASEWSKSYIFKLQEKAKKQLIIWPYHVMIGSTGNALDPELWSAVYWHSLAQKSQPRWLVKGNLPLTEHYSVIRPEVSVPDVPGGGYNREILEEIEKCDSLFIAGEAESHCVLETLEDIVEEFASQKQKLRKVFVLQDCTSPVQHPVIDFHQIAIDRFDIFKEQGIRFVNSSDALN